MMTTHSPFHGRTHPRAEARWSSNKPIMTTSCKNLLSLFDNAACSLPVVHVHRACGWHHMPSPSMQHHLRGLPCNAYTTQISVRPHIDDVDRLSRGEGARRRGTGCRDIPHRLNVEERPVYESSKKKGYLAVRGTGYRRERKGNPLPNIYRQWCDATASPCIVIEQDWAGTGEDTIVVDLSTLRASEEQMEQAEAALSDLAQRVHVALVPPSQRPPDAVPFNILLAPPPPPSKKGRPGFKAPRKPSKIRQPVETVAAGPQGFVSAAGYRSMGVEAAEQLLQNLQQKADEAAAEVRRLKEEEGWPNTDDRVQDGVAKLKAIRAELEQARVQVELSRIPMTSRQAALFDAFSDMTTPPAIGTCTDLPQEDEDEEEDDDDDDDGEEVADDQLQSMEITSDASAAGGEGAKQPAYKRSAIWQVPCKPMFFTAGRGEAKAFAKEAVTLLSGFAQR